MHSVLFKIPGFHLGPISLGPFPVHAYGTMLALAFIVAFFGLWKLTSRTKLIPPDRSIDVVLVVLLSGVLGARLLHVVLNWGAYFGNAEASPIEALYIWEGGLAFHGGVIGAMLGSLICCRKLRISYGALADHLVPLLALGYAITKIGCFLNGCCHGHPAEGLPWACQFPVRSGDLNVLTPPSHPVQIYDLILNLVVAAVLLQAFLKHRRWNGQILLWWIILYSITRIITDWFRYYEPVPAWSTAEAVPGMTGIPVIGAVTQAQLGSAAAIVAAVIALIACRRCTFTERVDLRVVPAFALGSLPVMAFAFYWQSRQGGVSAMSVTLYALGILVAVFGYPAVARRFSFSEEEARRGSPLGGVTYWDDTAEGGPSGSSHETHASGTSPGNTEGDQDGTDRVS